MTYSNVLDQANKLKRHQGEQISVYTTRILDIYDKLEALHPTKDMSKGTIRSDTINKLLELLPNDQRLWIKHNDTNVNTFHNVLQQVIQLCETNKSMKLSMEDINKECRPKYGTREVDTVAEIHNNKDGKGKSISNQPANQSVNNVSEKANDSKANSGGKDKQSQGNSNGNNPRHVNVACYFCGILGHVARDCRKKKFAEKIGQ